MNTMSRDEKVPAFGVLSVDSEFTNDIVRERRRCRQLERKRSYVRANVRHMQRADKDNRSYWEAEQVVTGSERRRRKAQDRKAMRDEARMFTEDEVQTSTFAGFNPFVVQNMLLDFTLGHQFKPLIGHYVKMDMNQSFLAKLVEDFVLFNYMMYRARNAADRAVAMMVFAKARDIPISERNLAAFVCGEVFRHFFSQKDEKQMEVQSWEFADVRSFINKYDVIKASPLYEKLYKFGMYALSLSMFKSAGLDMDWLKFDKIAQAAVKKEYHMGPDFLHCMLDTIEFLCSRGYQCYKTGELSPLFHSEKQYQEWYDQAEKLLKNGNFLSNPAPLGIDRFAFLADLKDCIEKGRSIKKFMAKPAEKAVVAKLLCSLELLHDLEVTKRAAQKDRPSPLCLLLYGGSSIGKSTLTQILFQHYGKVQKLNTAPEFKYTRNPTEEFWSNFNSTQWCIQMDDIGFLSPKLGTLDPSLAELLCVANNVPFVPAQAELQDKGRTPVRAELVIGTTNTKNLNLVSYFSCPLAVQRRFPYVIEAIPKPEFNKAGMLDTSKLPPVEDQTYPDYWHFVITRVVPGPRESGKDDQRGLLDKVGTFTTMKDFLKWYTQVIHAHSLDQDAALSSMDKVASSTLCVRCELPSEFCDCTQSWTTLMRKAEDSANDVKDRFESMRASYISECCALVASEREVLSHHVTSELPLYERCILAWYAIWIYLGTYFWIDFFFSLVWGPYWRVNMAWQSKHKGTLTRMVLQYAGKRINQSIDAPKAIMTLCAAFATGVGLYLLIKSVWSATTALVPQAFEGSYGQTPPPDDTQRIVRSYEDKYACNSADLSQSSLSAKGRPKDTIVKHIKRAMVVFDTNHGKVRRNCAFNYKSDLYVVNNHGIPPVDYFLLNVISDEACGLSSGSRDIQVDPSMILRIPEKDLAFIRLRCRPPGTDLSEYFVMKSYIGKVDGALYGRRATGYEFTNPVKNIDISYSKWPTHDVFAETDTWKGRPEVLTEKGDCGAVLFSQTNGIPLILGIHVLGYGTECESIRINRELLTRVEEQFPAAKISRGKVEVSAPSAPQVLEGLNVQSIAREMKSGTCNVLGSLQNYARPRNRSNVIPTLIRDSMVKRGYPEEKTAPEFGKGLWRHAWNDMTQPVTMIKQETLDTCVDQFWDDIQDAKLDYKKTVMVYDDKTAINGAAGVLYCDKMNRKSSMGFPWRKSKKHFMQPVESNPGEDLMTFTPEVMDMAKEIIATYHRGERAHAIFSGCPKDEPISHAKAEAKKVRLFTMANAAWTLVVRKYLLSVIVLMQKNRFLFEAGPGIVAQSLEWHELMNFLTKFGRKRIVAGDYAKFDKRMPATAILAAFEIILRICKAAGYSEEDLAVVRGIAYDTAFPTVNMNGDVVEFFGSNPSGHPLTVIINSLVNSIYMRYCFFTLREEYMTQKWSSCHFDNALGKWHTGSEWSYVKDREEFVYLITLRFKDAVALMTYGDDNAMSISEKCPWFNHSSIQRCLAMIGIDYTMADKESESVPYIDFEQCSFLKRTWRYDGDLGVYVAPLDPTSIAKMVTICTAKNNISPSAHAAEVISTAVREYFFYGREIFEEKVAMFKDVVSENDLELYVSESTFPTYESLVESFWYSSQHVNVDGINVDEKLKAARGLSA